MGAEESQQKVVSNNRIGDVTLSSDLLKLMKECFEIIDIDKNGNLSKYEIETKFRRTSSHDEMGRVLGFFNQMDIDHDDEVSYEEFINFWRAYKASSKADD